jgi:DNA-directed RNA polymerase specialized sigma24 family protein
MARHPLSVPDDRDHERAQQTAADKQLYEALKQAGFQGPLCDRFEDVLARYGIQVIRAWVLTMKIFGYCLRNRVKGAGISGRVGRPFTDDEADQLTNDTVAAAIRSFRRVLMRGGWSPSGGASLHTFFIGQCLYVFPGIYRRWQRENRHMLEVPLDDAAPILQRADPSPTADPANLLEIRAEVLEALLHAVRNDRARSVLILRAEGYSNREIADLFDETEKAIEGVFYRHRQQQTLRMTAISEEGGEHG